MNFWRSKRVLITGHTGFKGSWLALWLQHLNAEVVGIALPPLSSPNLFTAADIGRDMLSIDGDIRDFALLKKLIHQHKPEVVFHLAAQPLVRDSYLNPIETYETNVMGTVNLLEAIRVNPGIKVIVNVTTDKCYENNEWHWGYRETDRIGGLDPYSNSKACSELVTVAYRESYFKDLDIGISTARAGNVIGGGDWAKDRLIPDIIRAGLESQALKIRHPNAYRPWQHVLEPLRGYLMLAEKLYTSPTQYSESWNFGPNEEDIQPVSWIANYLTRKINNTSWIHDNKPHPHEARYLKLDCAKAKNIIGWNPRWNLTKALDETLMWYQAYYEHENMFERSLNQIKYYNLND